MMPQGLNGTCYKGGLTVNKNYQQCNVTNAKIIRMLPGTPPQVTFSCDRPDRKCDFQFWVGEVESFFCSLGQCDVKMDTTVDSNITIYGCDKVRCNCIKDQFLCGKDGSVDISDFLKDSIRGPGKFTCDSAKGCRFEEPAMNDLILQMFGDDHIELNCDSGECLHYSQIPGFERPTQPDRTVAIALGIGAVFLILVTIVAFAICAVRRSRKPADGYEALPSEIEDLDILVDDHIPASVMFNGVSYSIGEKRVLYDVYGRVNSGQVMAIMGASGAGKSTFLDILARRRKRGDVSGDFFVNDQSVGDTEFKCVVGYVDQEDTLMPTLTVYETILYSALLRLPRDMTKHTKKLRVLETINELGLMHIRDHRIGDTGKRGISGGEKRRVSIACELVTSPSVLFLDEPTSGLDAYNAYNVVEALVTLARNFNRTVICTIHQPRSNIYALFDQLILLASGRVVYSGDAQMVRSHFEKIGHPCPPGFNIADFIVDLTMHASVAAVPRGNVQKNESSSSGTTGDQNDADFRINPAICRPSSGRQNSQSSVKASQEELLYSPYPVPGLPGEPLKSPSIGEGTLPYWENELAADESGDDGDGLTDHLRMLVQAYRRSEVGKSLKAEIVSAAGMTTTGPHAINTLIISPSFRKSSWLTQFCILSGRTLKNLCRNPALLLTHYAISVFIALVCGLLFFRVSNDISGFQNRMGVMFFLCALLGFGCLTSLQVLAAERILFVRERANGYYSPFTYFASKVLFDIIPLRVVPPVLLGIIVYQMVGLSAELASLGKFLLVLVLFNLTAAAVCLFIGVACKDVGVASLMSSLVMLFAMLFGGLLLNKDSLPRGMQWLKDLSFFHSAFEAMMVNEMVNLQLTENKYGLVIDVPGAIILSSFGLDAAAFWPDVWKLSATFCIFILASFAWLQKFVKEKR